MGMIKNISAAMALVVPGMLMGMCMLALAACQTGGGGAPKKIALADIPAPSAAPAKNLKEAEKNHRIVILRDSVKAWERAEQQKGGTGNLARADAAAGIALGAWDCRWAEVSAEIYTKALDGGGRGGTDGARIRARRGAAVVPCIVEEAEALFGVGDLISFIPGPDIAFLALDAVSFARDIDKNAKRKEAIIALYGDLDAAVRAAPDDPLVRILRAHSYAIVQQAAAPVTKKQPGIFSGNEVIAQDFALLDRWTQNPASNPAHAQYLQSTAWKKMYYLMRARSLVEWGKFATSPSAESRAAWQNLMDISDDRITRDLAKFNLAEK